MADNEIDSDALVFFGGAVKALGHGKVGGHLVLFSTANDPDLTRDFFDTNTDFDIEEESKSVRVLYDHGRDPVLKARKLGRGTVKIDDVGVWIETQLTMRDEYEKAIYKLAESGKLGWSSGSAPHLVQKEAMGKSFYVKSWPLIEGSLTIRPTEPRTSAIALKSVEHVDLETLILEDGVDQKDIETTKGKEELLERLPALKAMINGLTVKGLNEISRAVEAAEEEFTRHGQMFGDGLKIHVAHVENNAQFRYEKDGRPISNEKRQHVEAMRKSLSVMSDDLKQIDGALAGVQKMFELTDSQQKAITEQARVELWRLYRNTGLRPEELG